MSKVLIDTHILIWLIEGNLDKLTDQMIEVLTQADEIFVASISFFEVAWLVQHHKIDLSMPYIQWFEIVKNQMNISNLDMTAEIASQAVMLPEHHKDPHDRIIIATALFYQYKLISLDSKFALYNQLDELLVI